VQAASSRPFHGAQLDIERRRRARHCRRADGQRGAVCKVPGRRRRAVVRSTTRHGSSPAPAPSAPARSWSACGDCSIRTRDQRSVQTLAVALAAAAARDA
jgi:hypothetical protein